MLSLDQLASNQLLGEKLEGIGIKTESLKSFDHKHSFAIGGKFQILAKT
jgi:hypothetical protein